MKPHFAFLRRSTRARCLLAASLATSILLTTRSFAQSGASTPQTGGAKLAAAPRRPAIDRERLCFDQRDDALWVHGKNWKGSFSRTGTSFIPFFGSKAPRNYPIAFTLESARRGGASIVLSATSEPKRTGTRVEIDRGGLVERYDLAPDELEQSFTFASLPANDGDLVVRVRVDTELESHAAPDGIDFANELGRVHYGAAKVVDARGREQALDGVLVDGRIELRVPQDYVAEAALPVTIDPVLNVFAIDHSSAVDHDPDVAFDALSNNYLIVYQEDHSASDHDVVAELWSGAANFITYTYIDSSTQDWVDPSVGCNAPTSEFLVAASVHVPLATGWNVMGRVSHATNLATGAPFQINENYGYDMHHPRVGGEGTFVPPSYYLVVWQEDAGTANNILGRLVNPGGSVHGSTIPIDNSFTTHNITPEISKSDGAAPSATQEWSVVWHRPGPQGDWDIYGAEIFWDGTVLSGPFPIDTTPGIDDVDAHVSSVLDGPVSSFIERPHMVVYMRNTGTDFEIHYSVLRGSSLITSGTLSALEQNGLASQYQLTPAVDADGHKFAIVYSESYQGSATDYDTWLTTVELAGTQVVPSEIHAQLGFTNGHESMPAIASRHSGGGGEWDMWAVWDNNGSDIDAAVYSAPPFTSICNPGADAASCPCGNNPLGVHRGCNNSANTGGGVMSGVGAASTDSVTLTASSMLPNATTVFWQGTTYLGWHAGLPFGDGVRCIGGSLLRIAVKTASGGSASFPGPNDASIKQTSAAKGAPIAIGSQRFYQATYRDPASYACSDTFNGTNGLIIAW
jgi:hypothetical protein